MFWKDEGYLLSKNNFSENSIIIETFTLDHGKCSGIVYGGSSKKKKKIFQVGNKILINQKSKNENSLGYFIVELIKPIAPIYFDDKKRSICILAASSILKILLPDRQVNKKIYDSFDSFLDKLNSKDWIQFYIYWELSLIKELGYEIDFFNNKNITNKQNYISINETKFSIPNLLADKNMINYSNNDIREALLFNRNLFMENFINPNRLSLPLSRKILERYYF